MKLSRLKIFALKLALYSGGLLYLAIDLFAWHGPLWDMLYEREQKRAAEKAPTAISVYGDRISTVQFNRRAAELRAISGKEDINALTEQDLITNALLRIRAKYNDTRIPDFIEEAKAETAALLTRAANEDQAEEWLNNHGYTKESFTAKLAAVMREQYYLENLLREHSETSDAEVESMAGQLGEYLVMPEKRQVRHIFFSTLYKNKDTVKAQAEQVLQQLLNHTATFDALAAQHSADARTARHGGDLGTLYAYPPHPLAELPLFGPDAIPADTPTLVHSKWGWHIILAGPIQEPRPLTPEEYKESIRTAISNYKRGAAINSWIEANVNEANKKNRIKTYNE